ncbi:MAG: ABC transporter ATP-binding protein [Cyclobacteriaceae bacterium]|nr:ABC transporter ATP-binding protein [Cyclobacteriaceae bacterium]MCK5470336.1 ABC transporter ATP-binding protein [Cyclobacteriaceae bacterium]
MKELSYLNKYFIKYKGYLLFGLLFVILSTIFQILPAQLVRYALDLVAENLSIYKSFEGLELQDVFRETINKSIVFYGVLILLIALLRGLFLFLVRQTIIVMSRHIEYDLKNEVFSHYQTLPLSFYRKNNTGDLIARISEDVNKVRLYIGPAIMYGLNMVILALILLPVMFSISVKLTLYALIPLPILSLSIYFVNNIINKRSEEIQESLSDLSTFVQEAFSGIRVLKSFAREADSLGKFALESDHYKKKSLQLTQVNAMFFPLIMSLIGLSVVLTIFVGGAEVIKGTLSIGNIAEFILYVNLLTWPVTALGWVTSIIQRAAASQKRINEFLKIKNDIVSEQNIEQEIVGQIEFRNVSFTYQDTGIKALRNITFKVNPGESLAIIGTTGSGKSTVANLIGRMFDPTLGSIYVDGIDLRHYNPTWFRDQIGCVPQDVFLFSDTISNNVAFGLDSLDNQKTIEALKHADLYQNVMEFPKQLETILGERGITLSGGQKQRLSIARALAKEPRLLILDDCLSAVDTKTENNILNSLKKIMADKTSIVISHRVSSAKLADKIIVLDDGRIIESGTYNELMAFNSTFKQLYEKQLISKEIEE